MSKMHETEGFLMQLTSTLLAAADPATRARMIPRLRQSVHKEINEKYGCILGVTPTAHFLPLQPKGGKEEDVMRIVNESIAWLSKQPGMLGVYLYELVHTQDAGEQGGPLAPPRYRYLLTLLCADRDVMVRLRRHKDGARLQAGLNELCEGISATDEGDFGVNTLFVGLT